MIAAFIDLPPPQTSCFESTSEAGTTFWGGLRVTATATLAKARADGRDKVASGIIVSTKPPI